MVIIEGMRQWRNATCVVVGEDRDKDEVARIYRDSKIYQVKSGQVAA